MRGILLYWTAIAAIGLAVRGQGWRHPWMIAEFAIYLLLLLALARQPALRRRWQRLQRRQQVIAGACFALLLLGQFMPDSRWLYPFVRWSMFAERQPSESPYYEYVVHRADGTTTTLLASGVPDAAALLERLHPLALDADAATRGLPTRAPEGLLADVLRAVAARHNRAHPGAAIDAIDVVRCTVPLHDFRGDASIDRALVRRVASR